MALKDHVPPKLYLNSKQLAAIGRFAARWAYFESEMDFSISALKALQKEREPIPLGFADRLRYWKKLTLKQFAQESGLKAYLHIIEQVGHGQSLRSSILHGRSLGDPVKKNGTQQIAFSHHFHRPRGWSSRLWKITPSELNQLSKALGQYASWLKKLNAYYFGAAGVMPTALPCKYPRSPANYRNPRSKNRTGLSPAIRLRSSNT